MATWSAINENSGPNWGSSSAGSSAPIGVSSAPIQTSAGCNPRTLSRLEKEKVQAMCTKLIEAGVALNHDQLVNEATDAVLNGLTADECIEKVNHQLQGKDCGGSENGAAPEPHVAALRLLNQPVQNSVDDDEDGEGCTLLQLLTTRFPATAPKRRFLVVGDGNCSFSVSLDKLLDLRENLTCSVHQKSKADLFQTYPEAEANYATLQDRQAKVLFGVDVIHPKLPKTIQPHTYDCVIFNFPHNGVNCTGVDGVQYSNLQPHLELNQYLVQKYLMFAHQCLAEYGLVVLTLNRRKPYVKWNASKMGLKFFMAMNRVRFHAQDFECYTHVKTVTRSPNPVFIGFAQSLIFHRPTPSLLKLSEDTKYWDKVSRCIQEQSGSLYDMAEDEDEAGPSEQL